MRPRALDIKLLLLVTAILSIGMGMLTYVNIRRHEQDLLAGLRAKAETVADSLCAGIRSIMRTGDVCRARDYVRDIRSVEGIANLKIYNAGGGEAYLYPEAVSVLAAADQNVSSVIESGRAMTIDMAGGKATAVIAPLLNEKACHRCHGAEHRMRGVFSIAFRIREDGEPGRSDLMRRALSLLNNTISAFFEGLMLSDLGTFAKDYVASLMLVPGVEQVVVYDRGGEPKFSTPADKAIPTLTPEDRDEILGSGQAVARGLDAKGATEIAYLRPLPNRESCQACHKNTDRPLGVVGLWMNASALSGGEKGNVQNALADTMVSLVTRCLQEVMKIGGVAPVRTFIQQFRALPEVTDLKIFDPKGREVYPDKVTVEDNVQKVFLSGRSLEVTEEENNQQYLSLLKPVFNDTECRRCHGSKDKVRAVIVASVSLENVRERITKGKAFSVAAASGTVLLVCLLIVGFIEMVIVRPVRKIGEVADRVGAGNLSLRADDGKADEFGLLARRINAMIEGLTDKQRIEQSLRIARDIQRSHLPKRNPDVPGLDVAGWSLPADETAGDYYDFIPGEEGRLLIVLADVTSHGIGPALIMSQTRALVRAAFHTVKDMPKAISIVNHLLCQDLTQGRFVTLFIGEIDPAARTLRYVSAGHIPPLLLRKGTAAVEDLRTTGLPLGINPDAAFDAGPVVQLHPGDVLLLATDGASETANERGEHFGRERLQEGLVANASRSSREIVEEVSTAIRKFRAQARQRDDLTMVVVRIGEREAE